MNELKRILNLPEVERRSEGVYFTPKEIYQQPKMWRATIALIEQQAEELKSFLENSGVYSGGPTTIYLLGAGTSEYVGNAVADTLRRSFGISCTSLPTTTFLPSPEDWIFEGGSYLFIHFARSGDSPESVASYRTARELAPKAHHLVITCNREGGLAREPVSDERLYIIVLPEETNDQSLVMTSSYSSMALAATALGHLGSLSNFRRDVEATAEAAQEVLDEKADMIRGFVQQCGARIQYLGTGNLYGSMEESRLKVLEMTSGRVAANVNTFLGLRHGPQVFINSECGVVAALSTDNYRRRYEIDLLRELRAKNQGSDMLIICDRTDPEIDALGGRVVALAKPNQSISNELRVLTDVVVGQLIGLFKSLECSLKPDNPSESGIINRVVSGVHIYPLDQLSAQE